MSGAISAFVALLLLLATARLQAEDWPEWRGKDRKGVWNETGIIDAFPASGLKVLWRTPVHVGFSGPAVSNGRVFLTDYTETQPPRGTERALALDEKTGKILWTYEWPANYGGIQWPNGPRATPTVDGDRVYMLGTNGKLFCFNVATGAVIWKKDYVADFGADPKQWGFNYGFNGAPIVEGNLLIAMAGGAPDSKVIAMNKLTGEVVWHALSSDNDLGNAQPVMITVGGVRQFIAWHPGGIASLDPDTGKIYWQHPWTISVGAPTPVLSGLNLFFTTFFDGPMMLALDAKHPAAHEAWRGNSRDEVQTDKLHGAISTPAIIDGHIYGICSYGQFRCLRVSDGQRIWETQAVTKERARFATAQIVTHGDRLFMNNDRGELIIVKPSPDGYQEISRTSLIKPTSSPGNRRQLVNVNWSHPAYANRHIYARNDEEIICATLAKDEQ
jgi:outer membrane protein assembly factor BamB